MAYDVYEWGKALIDYYKCSVYTDICWIPKNGLFSRSVPRVYILEHGRSA
jgi:hypothetical protein